MEFMPDAISPTASTFLKKVAAYATEPAVVFKISSLQSKIQFLRCCVDVESRSLISKPSRSLPASRQAEGLRLSRRHSKPRAHAVVVRYCCSPQERSSAQES